MKLIDRAGKRYGNTVVISRAPNKSEKDTNARWHCQCDCGNLHVAYGGDLGKGKNTNCGCLRKSQKGVPKTHGMSKTKVYRTWNHMRTRCLNKSDSHYPQYGGRGITVCERWEKFENFVSDMGLPTEDQSIDRIDNDKGYYPENCHWATAAQQANNRRTRRLLTNKGITLSLTQWAKILGITPGTMWERAERNIPNERLFARNMRN